MRDKSIDIMLSIGIIFVVLGHNYQPPWLFFPAYSFHMPLFFFISGYLFKIVEPKMKIKFVFKKIKKQLIPYYAIHIFFMILTLIMQKYNIFVEYHFDIKSIFLEPFFSGHQNPLIIPMWFLLQLFVLNILFQLIYWSETKINYYIVTIIILILGLFLTYKGLLEYKGWQLLIVRTGISAIFFQLGIIFSINRIKIIKLLKNPTFLFFNWIIVVILNSYFGNISYSIVWGSVKNNLFFIPLITSSLIVMIVFGISQILTEHINEDSIVIKIGQNTFFIMCFHLSFFFLINCGLYIIKMINKENLSNVYFHLGSGKTWIIYFISGIFGPIIIGKYFNIMKLKVSRNARNRITTKNNYN